MPNAFSLISIFLIQCDLISSENDLMRINSKCDVFQCCEIETELSRSTIFRLLLFSRGTHFFLKQEFKWNREVNENYIPK